MKKNIYPPSLSNRQSGMTLIEVLISMFVLAIGVLALLAVQLRTVSGVREAESQTIVSQITQNLIEGMLTNPSLSEQTDATGAVVPGGWAQKSYRLYHYSSSSSSCEAKWGNKMSKEDLKTAQICEFQAALASALPETKVHFSICFDSSGTAPTIENGSFKDNCDRSGSVTVVKTAWLKNLEKNADASDGSLNTLGDSIVYTYQARVAD